MSQTIEKDDLAKVDLTDIFNIIAPFLEIIGQDSFYERTVIHTLYAPRLRVVGRYAFKKCSNLRVVVGDQIETVERGAFQNCYNLSEINLSRARTIQQYAFFDCALQTVVNHQCDDVNFNAFGQNDQLDSVEMTKLTKLTFPNINEYHLSQLKLPALEQFSGKLKQTVQVTSDSAEILMSGREIVPEITLGPWKASFAKDFKQHLVNQESFVRNRVLYGNQIAKNMLNIKGVVLVNQREIGAKAFFQNCSINFVHASNVKLVKTQAFDGCKFLKSFFSRSLEEIEQIGFNDCFTLSRISLSNVVSLAPKNFWNCNSLIDVEMDKIVELPNYTFTDCKNLKQLRAKNLVKIGELCFYYRINVKIISDQNKNLQRQYFQEQYMSGFVERKRIMKLIKQYELAVNGVWQSVKYADVRRKNINNFQMGFQ